VDWYDIRPGNHSGSILTTPEPAGGYFSSSSGSDSISIQYTQTSIVRITH